ncbi:MAG: hypothetical protein ACTSPI_01240 [Candidatus Heimdallarchaeaceae archaeon]
MLNRAFKATPDYLAPTKFKIGTGTTTPDATDTDVETGVNINGGATKSFVSGYPTFDETNHQVTIRCFLTTVEGNTNNITELGLFNEDGTPLMYSHAVFTAISKTSSVEVSFVQKDKIE